MPADYYSDRVNGPVPRTREEVPLGVWAGIVAIVQCRVADNSFAQYFPDQCPDGTVICDTNSAALGQRIAAEIPGMRWPLQADELPPALSIWDLQEFLFKNISKAVQGDYHGYYSHFHLSFDEASGKVSFRDDVNGILARNGIAYELNEEGRIVRFGPEGLREILRKTVFRTEDNDLNGMLETARSKFLDPDLAVRREALEKLWDAWERIKSLEIPGAHNKRESIGRLLDKAASEPNFRVLLETEARALTDAGNKFQIRHSETHQTPLELSEHVDYMFHRLFALIRLLLRRSGRGG